MRSTALDEHSVRGKLGSRRKVDSSAGASFIQGEFRISYRVRTASWPMAGFSLTAKPPKMLSFYLGVNRHSEVVPKFLPPGRQVHAKQWPDWGAKAIGQLRVTHRGPASITTPQPTSLYRCAVCGHENRWTNPFDGAYAP